MTKANKEITVSKDFEGALATERQLAYLARHYAGHRAEAIAQKIRHPVRSVWRKAKQMRLAKE